MNPGPVEEASDIAKTTVHSLEKYPILLTLVIFQIVIILATAWISHERTLYFNESMKSLIERCGPRAGELPLEIRPDAQKSDGKS